MSATALQSIQCALRFTLASPSFAFSLSLFFLPADLGLSSYANPPLFHPYFYPFCLCLSASPRQRKKKEHVRGEAAVGLDDRLAGQAGLALQSIDILREATQQEALLV